MTISVCLLFFLRAPHPGRVKTRLARDVGDAAAVALYRACVEDMLDALDATGLPLALLVDTGGDAAGLGQPGDAGGDIGAVRRWLGAHRLYIPQATGDLGARLDASFRWAFAQGYAAAAALGSDVPLIDAAVLTQAARLLAERRTILGPSPDGGYWCIGFSREAYRPEVFEDMPWSEPELFGRTVEALAGQPLGLLPTLTDMDTLEDVREVMRSCPERQGRRVLAALRILGETPGRDILCAKCGEPSA